MNKLLTLISVMLFSSHLHAESITLGNTYEITEPDVLDEIKNRAEGIDWKEVYNKDPSTWAALKSPILPEAYEDSVRQHAPVYVVEQKVTDRYGKTIYPKGYRYNPLEYIQLPSRIIFIGAKQSHLNWLETIINNTDTVITSGGDPITLSKKVGRPVFMINDQWIDRLNLRAVPAIVEQVGTTLTISEYSIHEDSYDSVN